MDSDSPEDLRACGGVSDGVESASNALSQVQGHGGVREPQRMDDGFRRGVKCLKMGGNWPRLGNE